MVSAIDFFANREDEDALLNYLGEPTLALLHTWPICRLAPTALNRPAAMSRAMVMVAHRDLGPPRLIRPGDRSMEGSSRAALFNRMNWDRLRPDADEGLVDSNTSPVLLWQRGVTESDVLHQSAIGSQADSAHAVSRDYEKWVARVLSWVRRRGTRVWGLECHALREDLDIDIAHVSSIYALPGALAALECGVPGRR